MTPSEVQALLAELGRELDRDLRDLWRAGADSNEDFRRLIAAAFPEVVLPYSAAAAQIGASWYDSMPTTTNYVATVGELPPTDRLTSSVGWALRGSGEAALVLLQGVAQRGMADGLRSTVVSNVESERGARWARHASANACSFCRMLATRTDYRSQRTAKFKAHDSCHCIPVAVRPGSSFEPAPYVEQWRDQYFQARRDAGSGSTRAILNAWDRSLRNS